LSIAKHQHNAADIAGIRQRITTNATNIDYASRLWQFFRALISGALDELKNLLGDAADLIMKTIESHVQRFFVQALQLNPAQLRMEGR
jgi:hypothetical protein